MTGVYGTDSRNVQVTKSVFTDMGFHGVQFHYKNDNDELEGQTDITIDNNMFDGCGMSNFWQPACVKVGGYKNISVRNNEISNVPYNAIRIAGLMPHGGSYWDDNGVTEPTRDDYIFHVEFNYIHGYGLGMLNDMGAVYLSEYWTWHYIHPSFIVMFFFKLSNNLTFQLKVRCNVAEGFLMRNMKHPAMCTPILTTT